MDRDGLEPVLLTTTYGSFPAHVLAARLRAAEIPSMLRGGGDGPYPLPGEIAVFVPRARLFDARELLLGDAVDALFEDPLTNQAAPPRRSRFRRRAAR